MENILKCLAKNNVKTSSSREDEVRGIISTHLTQITKNEI